MSFRCYVQTFNKYKTKLMAQSINSLLKLSIKKYQAMFKQFNFNIGSSFQWLFVWFVRLIPVLSFSFSLFIFLRSQLPLFCFCKRPYFSKILRFFWTNFIWWSLIYLIFPIHQGWTIVLEHLCHRLSILPQSYFIVTWLLIFFIFCCFIVLNLEECLHLIL